MTTITEEIAKKVVLGDVEVTEVYHKLNFDKTFVSHGHIFEGEARGECFGVALEEFRNASLRSFRRVYGKLAEPIVFEAK